MWVEVEMIDLQDYVEELLFGYLLVVEAALVQFQYFLQLFIEGKIELFIQVWNVDSGEDRIE